MATAISDEARAIYNGWHQEPDVPGEHKGLIYRAPVINIGRNPYWGRNDEAYGEDPFLTGRMAVAYVTGLQGDDPKYLKLVSTLKHYAVNNVEQDRQSLSATVQRADAARVLAAALSRRHRRGPGPVASWPRTTPSTASPATSTRSC